jgi:hypothetical protein
MYDASNNGPDWIGVPDMPRFFDFEEDIKRRFNMNTNVPTKQEDIHADNDINGDETNSSDSFFSTTIETIQFLMREFTKVFEAYAGLD